MKIKIKKFIFRTPYNIDGVNPIRKEINSFGVTENFYIISDKNLEILLKNRYDKDFKERDIENINWFLNTNNVSIVNNTYQLERFIKKDYFEVMKLNSNTNVFLI